MNIIIVSNKEWHRKYISEIATRTGTNITYISNRDAITKDNISCMNPAYVFFPHWSYIIPAEVYENFVCIVFHMTDLPFGRGGSPLQNLISRGIYETKLSALRCAKELDAGAVYLKSPLSLWGNAEEIYLRAAEITKEMMIQIVRDGIQPHPQLGDPIIFKRRKPTESNMKDLDTLGHVFDYIRMLDADGYPTAFLDTEHLHLEFSRASLKDGYIHADVRVKMR